MTRVAICPGRWLDASAAASYARMLAAGMPAGGIAAAGRTRAQQLALWLLWKAGKGNRAAFPGPKAFHMTGMALDVSRGSAAWLWLVHGTAAPLRMAPTEVLRANEYGWVRTVTDEAWHFQYFPARDLHRPKPLPTLRVGSVGPLVRAVQAVVGAHVDGTYGPATREAVKGWQHLHHLTPDGIAGPATLTAMHITPSTTA